MNWKAWIDGFRGRRGSADRDRNAAWRWRAPDTGRGLGSYGRGAPRLAFPTSAEMQQTLDEVRARWETYQEEHPYRTLVGNLAIGLVVGMIIGRQMRKSRS